MRRRMCHKPDTASGKWRNIASSQGQVPTTYKALCLQQSSPSLLIAQTNITYLTHNQPTIAQH